MTRMVKAERAITRILKRMMTTIVSMAMMFDEGDGRLSKPCELPSTSSLLPCILIASSKDSRIYLEQDCPMRYLCFSVPAFPARSVPLVSRIGFAIWP